MRNNRCSFKAVAHTKRLPDRRCWEHPFPQVIRLTERKPRSSEQLLGSRPAFTNTSVPDSSGTAIRAGHNRGGSSGVVRPGIFTNGGKHVGFFIYAGEHFHELWHRAPVTPFDFNATAFIYYGTPTQCTLRVSTARARAKNMMNFVLAARARPGGKRNRCKSSVARPELAPSASSRFLLRNARHWPARGVQEGRKA